MFLLLVGLFTLINMDSLIALAKPYPSMPYMLKLPSLVQWTVMETWQCMGDCAFKCSLNHFPNGSGRYSYVLTVTIHLLASIPIDNSTSLFHGVLISG